MYRVFAQEDMTINGVAFTLADIDAEGRPRAIAAPVFGTMVRFPIDANASPIPPEKDPGPTFKLTRKAVQDLYDRLHQLGYRPNPGAMPTAPDLDTQPDRFAVRPAIGVPGVVIDPPATLVRNGGPEDARAPGMVVTHPQARDLCEQLIRIGLGPEAEKAIEPPADPAPSLLTTALCRVIDAQAVAILAATMPRTKEPR